MDLIRLKILHIHLGLVLTRNMSPHGVVAREGARAEGTGHADTLVSLPNVRPQIRLIPV